MSSNGGLGVTNPGKDYDVLFKIVLIGDSGLWLFIFKFKLNFIVRKLFS